SPYDGDWVYWSTKRGWHPGLSPRLAKLLKRQQGRCPSCGLCFHHDDCIEIDYINGDRRNACESNLQALHGHCHDAKRGSIASISGEVCVTSIRTLRDGVMRKYHTPFWSSGRRSDPPIDCNRGKQLLYPSASKGAWCVRRLLDKDLGAKYINCEFQQG